MRAQLTRAGERSVAKTLAESTGRSPDTMKQHLRRVRKEKMLTAISGRAGGQLTQRAIDTIRAANRQHGTVDGFVPHA
jgi:DNA-binding IscR family transcriptional regulator